MFSVFRWSWVDDYEVTIVYGFMNCTFALHLMSFFWFSA